MADHEIRLTTPVGRMIGGSLYKGRDKDKKGVPYIYKNGAKKGQPYMQYNFGVAFPKSPGVTHWASEAWLSAVWQLGHAAFPQGHAQRKDFSWKIIDGDSTEPNGEMKRPCDQVGYPGHWVVWYSGTTAPKVTNANGSQIIADVDAVKPGYFVQVFCDVTDNKPSETPGLYWNAHYVALAGFGPEISFGPDVGQAAFGQGVQLPAGASAVPLAGQAPGAGTPPPPPAPPGAPAPAPAAPPPPPPAPAAPAPAGLVQVPGAAHTIEACRAIGWTDEQLIAGGIATRAVAAAPAPAAPPPPPPPPAAPAAGAVPPPPGAVPVTPNPAFTQMAAPAPAAPPPPPPPPAAPAPAAVVRQPSAAMAGQGHTRDSLLAMPGWSEEMLVQHGHLV